MSFAGSSRAGQWSHMWGSILLKKKSHNQTKTRTNNSQLFFRKTLHTFQETCSAKISGGLKVYLANLLFANLFYYSAYF